MSDQETALCDVCHEPESEAEGELRSMVGWLPFGIRPQLVRAHKKCQEFVRAATDVRGETV